ncbi:uncharacterized protein LOC128237157 isoform X2 [Mya arenaria]|nr:uncharacterized protein LOC128237157 isoform X2 [Mya arenaria]
MIEKQERRELLPAAITIYTRKRFIARVYLFIAFACRFIVAQGDREQFSNYTNAKGSCHNRSGLITQEMLTFSGLINITCELGLNDDVLKDGNSVWVKGRAQKGPYLTLYTCMRFKNQDKNSFAGNMTFYSNILYECSLFCDQVLHSIGYLGIYNDSCICMYDSFRFPHTPECLGNDFTDIHKGIIVFRLIGNMQFDVQSKSANFNCLGASFQDSGTTSYYNTKCASMLYSICTQRVDSDLSNECVPRHEEFCFNEENNTFLEHYRKCWLKNGTLIPFNSGIPKYINSSVMLGSFRTFRAIEDDGENKNNVSWSCLSITRNNGTIYMETENCSNENEFICMDDIQGSETKDGGKPNTDTLSYGLISAVAICGVLIVLCILLILLKITKVHKNTCFSYKPASRSDDNISSRSTELE